MALVPFTYANPYTDQLRLPERLFTIDGRVVKIKQGWKPGGKGGTEIGFGASVYPAAYVLAEFLERHPYIVRGKRVIELGTGTGFLGIAAAALEVCLTDGDDDSLRLAQTNVTANLPSINLPNQPPAAVYVQRLRWGNSADIEAVGVARMGAESWDVIIGSDIAAFPYALAYTHLLNTIVSLANVRLQSDGQVVENNRSDCGKSTSTPAASAAGWPEPARRTEERMGREREAGGRNVVVLLAHKRRHISEETFFEAARDALGDGGSLGVEDLHQDFRDAGIRLHMFTVDGGGGLGIGMTDGEGGKEIGAVQG